MKKVWFLVLGIATLLFLAACSTGEATTRSKQIPQLKCVQIGVNSENIYAGQPAVKICQKALGGSGVPVIILNEAGGLMGEEAPLETSEGEQYALSCCKID
ncbi:MAG TPA: hypothetical protein VJG31_01480 [Candidatus Nanoarchaeia archaeon]|nr:hypothetical protein [Candidatus Nanoarchaeia archaeon]